MNEHTFARKLTKSLRDAERYVWKINANFAAGVPDMWVCGNGADLWLELKWLPDLPVRDATPVTPTLSLQQRLWLTDRYLQGVRVLVLCATRSGCILFDHPDEWRDGVTAGAARARLLAYKDAVAAVLSLTAPAKAPDNDQAHPKTEGISARRR